MAHAREFGRQIRRHLVALACTSFLVCALLSLTDGKAGTFFAVWIIESLAVFILPGLIASAGFLTWRRHQERKDLQTPRSFLAGLLSSAITAATLSWQLRGFDPGPDATEGPDMSFVVLGAILSGATAYVAAMSSSGNRPRDAEAAARRARPRRRRPGTSTTRSAAGFATRRRSRPERLSPPVA
jgi:hypothetical protein